MMNTSYRKRFSYVRKYLRKMQDELSSPNPNLGLVNRYLYLLFMILDENYSSWNDVLNIINVIDD